MSNEQAIVGVGWDVGGWRGKSQALAIACWTPGQHHLDWSSPGCGVSQPFSLVKAGGLSLKALVGQVSGASWALVSATSARVVVAIDAPLGFPEAFVRFVSNPTAQELPTTHGENRLAFRGTDRFVMQEYQSVLGTRPFSASLDALTHVGTVALAAVAALREAGYRLLPQDESVSEGARGRTRREAIEVYPALAKVPRLRAKKGEKKSPAALPSIRAVLPNKLTPSTGHRYDAAISAVMAVLFAAAGSLGRFPALVEPQPPCADVSSEGWIYGLPASFVKGQLQD